MCIRDRYYCCFYAIHFVDTLYKNFLINTGSSVSVVILCMKKAISCLIQITEILATPSLAGLESSTFQRFVSTDAHKTVFSISLMRLFHVYLLTFTHSFIGLMTYWLNMSSLCVLSHLLFHGYTVLHIFNFLLLYSC